MINGEIGTENNGRTSKEDLDEIQVENETQPVGDQTVDKVRLTSEELASLTPADRHVTAQSTGSFSSASNKNNGALTPSMPEGVTNITDGNKTIPQVAVKHTAYPKQKPNTKGIIREKPNSSKKDSDIVVESNSVAVVPRSPEGKGTFTLLTEGKYTLTRWGLGLGKNTTSNKTFINRIHKIPLQSVCIPICNTVGSGDQSKHIYTGYTYIKVPEGFQGRLTLESSVYYIEPGEYWVDPRADNLKCYDRAPALTDHDPIFPSLQRNWTGQSTNSSDTVWTCPYNGMFVNQNGEQNGECGTNKFGCLTLSGVDTVRFLPLHYKTKKLEVTSPLSDMVCDVHPFTFHVLKNKERIVSTTRLHIAGEKSEAPAEEHCQRRSEAVKAHLLEGVIQLHDNNRWSEQRSCMQANAEFQGVSHEKQVGITQCREAANIKVRLFTPLETQEDFNPLDLKMPSKEESPLTEYIQRMVELEIRNSLEGIENESSDILVNTPAPMQEECKSEEKVDIYKNHAHLITEKYRINKQKITSRIKINIKLLQDKLKKDDGIELNLDENDISLQYNKTTEELIKMCQTTHINMLAANLKATENQHTEALKQTAAGMEETRRLSSQEHKLKNKEVINRLEHGFFKNTHDREDTKKDWQREEEKKNKQHQLELQGMEGMEATKGKGTLFTNSAGAGAGSWTDNSPLDSQSDMDKMMQQNHAGIGKNN